MQPHVADHHQISDETLAARIQSTCLTRTVPHKICAAARTNVPLFTESKATRNPTFVVSDPSHNPHKHYCQIKMGNVKCGTLYMVLQLPANICLATIMTCNPAYSLMIIFITLVLSVGRGSSVSIVTDYGLEVQGSNPFGGEVFCSCPDRPWGPPSLPYNG